MSGYAPGPWRVAQYGRNRRAILAATNELAVAYVRADGHGTTKDGNARLISAAPDLLEALRAVLLFGTDDNYVKASEAVKSARAAISKATGEPQ